MKSKLIATGLLFSTIFSTPTLAVVNGAVADHSNYPFFARIGSVQVDVDSNSFEFDDFCGGSIIDESHILTAAHCFNMQLDMNSAVEDLAKGTITYDVNSDINVVLYNYSLDSGDVKANELKKIDKVVINNQLDQNLLNSPINSIITSDDVAVIKLSSVITDNVESISLLDSELDVNTNLQINNSTVRVAGSGNHFETKCEDGKSFSVTSLTHNGEVTENFFCDDLKEGALHSTYGFRDSNFRDVTTAFVNDVDCENVVDGSNVLGSGTPIEQALCYSHPANVDHLGNISNTLDDSTHVSIDNGDLGRSCTFDSGGPVVYEDSTGKMIQVGVVSYDTAGACSDNGLSVGMRIEHFKNWIVDATKASFNDTYVIQPTTFNPSAGDYTGLQHSSGDGLTEKEALEAMGLEYIPENEDVQPPSGGDDSNSSGSSGGSTGLITLFGLGLLALRRKK